MQPYKLNQKKVNLKACDQCYRCKVKCTMELDGCTRCRTTNGVCTYSLGKWMGRPKKSSQQASHVTASKAKGTRGASLEIEKDYFDQITNMPNENPYWDLTPLAMDDLMEFSEHAAISPFSTDDHHKLRCEGHYSSTNGSLGRPSSVMEMDSRAESLCSDSRRETPDVEIETTDDVSSWEYQQNHHTQHPGGSNLCSHTAQTPGYYHDFNSDSIGMDLKASPQVSLTTNSPMQIVEQAQRTDSQQIIAETQQDSVLSTGESHHCKCSQVALACLNKIFAVSSEARYVNRLEVIRLTFLNTESLVFCNRCTPNMIIAKCCIILGNAYELVRGASAQSEDKVSSNITASHQLGESVRHVKRRAAMLFAGLNTLQSSKSRGWGLFKMQSEFLTLLAESWASLLEE